MSCIAKSPFLVTTEQLEIYVNKCNHSCAQFKFLITVNYIIGLLGLRLTLGMIGKFCITMSFDSIYTWSTELYPTVTR